MVTNIDTTERGANTQPCCTPPQQILPRLSDCLSGFDTLDYNTLKAPFHRKQQTELQITSLCLQHITATQRKTEIGHCHSVLPHVKQVLCAHHWSMLNALYQTFWLPLVSRGQWELLDTSRCIRPGLQGQKPENESMTWYFPHLLSPTKKRMLKPKGKHCLTPLLMEKKGGEIKNLHEGQRQRKVPSFLLHFADLLALFCSFKAQMMHTRFIYEHSVRCPSFQ